MTEYFEVKERDGAARLGELRLTESRTTPALIDDVRSDAGSEWPTAQSRPEGTPDQLTILPHRGLPGGTPEEVQTAFGPSAESVAYPAAAVVTPDTADDLGVDAYALSNAQELVGHARAFVAAIIRTRRAIPPDTGLYLSGIATPANVPTLAGAGVDLVDADRAVVAGTEGWYLTLDGRTRLADLGELPCRCPACQQSLSSFDREDCVAHNRAALEAALATVRERIRRGRLRDFLEGQARHEQWLTATLRRLDQEYSYVEQRAPIHRRAEITAATDDTLRRVEIQRFAERVTNRYRCRFDEPLLLVPCSARKPYSESQSHQQFHDVVQWRAHTVSITSPIGVVPQELELTYPAQHYDAVVTGTWTPTEIEFVADVLAAYIHNNEYDRVIAHVPPEYRQICERVESELGREFEYTVSDHPTTSEALDDLSAALEGGLQYSKREREHYTIRAIADYQFGEGAGEAMFDDLTTESRYPKLRALDGSGTQLATLVAQYGLLALTLAGGRRWQESETETKTVEIDDFVPHGSVLAPGVVESSGAIRVGDEVVVEGPSAFAVGRATMSGPEMARSSRGIAVDVRHVEER